MNRRFPTAQSHRPASVTMEVNKSGMSTTAIDDALQLLNSIGHAIETYNKKMETLNANNDAELKELDVCMENKIVGDELLIGGGRRAGLPVGGGRALYNQLLAAKPETARDRRMAVTFGMESQEDKRITVVDFQKKWDADKQEIIKRHQEQKASLNKSQCYEEQRALKEKLELIIYGMRSSSVTVFGARRGAEKDEFQRAVPQLKQNACEKMLRNGLDAIVSLERYGALLVASSTEKRGTHVIGQADIKNLILDCLNLLYGVMEFSHIAKPSLLFFQHPGYDTVKNLLLRHWDELLFGTSSNALSDSDLPDAALPQAFDWICSVIIALRDRKSVIRKAVQVLNEQLRRPAIFENVIRIATVRREELKGTTKQNADVWSPYLNPNRWFQTLDVVKGEGFEDFTDSVVRLVVKKLEENKGMLLAEMLFVFKEAGGRAVSAYLKKFTTFTLTESDLQAFVDNILKMEVQHLKDPTSDFEISGEIASPDKWPSSQIHLLEDVLCCMLKHAKLEDLENCPEMVIKLMMKEPPISPHQRACSTEVLRAGAQKLNALASKEEYAVSIATHGTVDFLGGLIKAEIPDGIEILKQVYNHMDEIEIEQHFAKGQYGEEVKGVIKQMANPYSLSAVLKDWCLPTADVVSDLFQTWSLYQVGQNQFLCAVFAGMSFNAISTAYVECKRKRRLIALLNLCSFGTGGLALESYSCFMNGYGSAYLYTYKSFEAIESSFSFGVSVYSILISGVLPGYPALPTAILISRYISVVLSLVCMPLAAFDELRFSIVMATVDSKETGHLQRSLRVGSSISAKLGLFLFYEFEVLGQMILFLFTFATRPYGIIIFGSTSFLILWCRSCCLLIGGDHCLQAFVLAGAACVMNITPDQEFSIEGGLMAMSKFVTGHRIVSWSLAWAVFLRSILGHGYFHDGVQRGVAEYMRVFAQRDDDADISIVNFLLILSLAAFGFVGFIGSTIQQKWWGRWTTRRDFDIEYGRLRNTFHASERGYLKVPEDREDRELLEVH